MIYLGVEYGCKYTLENVSTGSSGKVNKVVDPIFSNASLAAQWETGSVTVALRGTNALIPIGTRGSRAEVEVAAATSGFIGTKTAIKVGVERVDYGFWVQAPVGAAMALESISYKTGETSPSGAAVNFTGTGVWQWVSANRTMPAETTEAKFRVKTLASNAGIVAFYVWGGMATTGRTTLISSSEYFPTIAQLGANEARWAGTESASATELFIINNRAVFNDPTDVDFVGVLSPESSGLDAPEIREDSAERVENDGAIFGSFFAGKRPVVLQGEISATDPVDRNRKVAKLRRATNAKRNNSTLSWEPKGAGIKVYLNLRRGQPLRITKGYLKEFQASMVSADSRILSAELKTASAAGITTGTQEKLPTETGAGPSGDPAVWTTPENIKASDNVYATWKPKTLIELGGTITSGELFGKNYGFTIPATAIIVGVEVKPEAKASVASKIGLGYVSISRDIANEIIRGEDRNGLNGSEIRAGVFWNGPDFTFTFLTTADTTQVVGGPSNRWRYSKYLTPSIVNATKFGAQVEYNFNATETVSVDALPIKITYANPIEVTATNEGDAPAPAVIKITGPLENFYVMNEATGEILTYAGVLAENRTLVFDTEAVTAFEEGSGITEPINRFANVSFPNDWIQIIPGANKIRVGGLGGSGTKTELKVEWRHAWE